MGQQGKKTERSNRVFPTTWFWPNKVTAGLWSTRFWPNKVTAGLWSTRFWPNKVTAGLWSTRFWPNKVTAGLWSTRFWPTKVTAGLWSTRFWPNKVTAGLWSTRFWPNKVTAGLWSTRFWPNKVTAGLWSTRFWPNKVTAGLWSTRTYLDIWQWSTECPVQRTSDPVLHIWNQANATIQLTWSQKKIHRRKCPALHFCHLTFLYSVVFISVEFLAVFQKTRFYWIKLKLFLAHINWSLKWN